MIPDTQTQPGTAATRANARGAEGTCWSAREEATSTATQGLSAARPRLLSGSVCRDEELAVGALEAAVPFGLSGHEFGPERFLAVRALDLVRGVWCGKVRHVVTVPAARAPGRHKRLRSSPQQDFPGLDPDDPQHSHWYPRIPRESRLDVLLAIGRDDVQGPGAVADRAAEDDEALVDEPIHERGVLVPLCLLAQRTRRIPVRSLFARDGVVDLSQEVVAST